MNIPSDELDDLLDIVDSVPLVWNYHCLSIFINQPSSHAEAFIKLRSPCFDMILGHTGPYCRPYIVLSQKY